jgi:chemotaxis protein CheX
MIDVLEDLVKGAVSEVFSTMLSIKTEADPSLKLLSTTEPHIASSVGFIGQVTGVVFIYSNDSFAKVITSRMLGMDPKEVDSEEIVNDSMGELGNMVVGHIKSRLCDRGMSCVLTIPSIVRGTQFSIQPVTSATRIVMGFRCDAKNQLAIELLLKDDEGPQP